MLDLPLTLPDPRLAGAIEEKVWLLGQPPLQDYLDLVENSGLADPGQKQLCDEWRRANDHYHELELSEAGIADQMQIRELTPDLIPLAKAVKADRRFRRAFDSFPTELALVELDRLIVYQHHVTRPFVDNIQARLGPAPTDEAIFRLCLPTGGSDTPARAERVGSRRFLFSSESTDFRFNEAVLLRPEQITDLTGFGSISSVLGILIGFGSNFLNAVRFENRFVLQNGYHRAYALRALGLKYAPCAVQRVTRRDELAVAASQTVVDAAAFYFKASRPPLLKDFFDPALRKIVPVRRMRNVIEVTFEVREFRMEA